MDLFNQNYNLIYALIAFVTLVFASTNDFKRKLNDFNIGLFIVVIFCFIYILLFGSRDYLIGSDTLAYKLIWDLLKDFEFSFEFFTEGIMYILKKNNFSYTFFLYVFSTLFIVPLFLSIKNFAKQYSINPIYILLFFSSMFFFKSMGINIIRQGVSLAFFLFFLSKYNFKDFKKNKLSVFLIAAISIVIHNTTILPLLLIIFLSIFYRLKLNILCIIYFISIILSYFKYGFHTLLKRFTFLDERRVNLYVVSEDEWFFIGFKPQFVVFNTFFLIIFMIIRSFVGANKQYNIFLKYYIIMSCLFFMSFQMPYSDRWGIMSWIIIPILLIPIFNNNFKPKSIKTVSCFVLMFIYTFFTFYFDGN